jgi:hypothetical protein
MHAIQMLYFSDVLLMKCFLGGITQSRAKGNLFNPFKHQNENNSSCTFISIEYNFVYTIVVTGALWVLLIFVLMMI